MKDIYESILDCKETNLNPTIIFNEGWMTRLLVEYSIKEKIVLDKLNFGNINNWTSEALISNPFIRCKKCREGYTHTDISFGDYKIDYSKRGEISINNSKMFGVIEAKMRSNLSKGTTNVKEYNQATRNIVCLAYNIGNTDCDTYFVIVAPSIMIKKYKLLDQIKLENILEQVEKRFKANDEAFENSKDYIQIVENIKKIKRYVFSYEEWISKFTNENTRNKLESFYSKCLTWNSIG